MVEMMLSCHKDQRRAVFSTLLNLCHKKQRQLRQNWVQSILLPNCKNSGNNKFYNCVKKP